MELSVHNGTWHPEIFPIHYSLSDILYKTTYILCKLGLICVKSFVFLLNMPKEY